MNNIGTRMLLLLFIFFSKAAFALDNSVISSSFVFKLIFSLALVCFIAIAIFFVIKKLKLNIILQGPIKVIASTSLSNSSKIAVIELDEKQYLVGVTSGSVNLIDKLENNIQLENNNFNSLFNEAKAR